MSSKFNILYHGSSQDVLDYLDSASDFDLRLVTPAIAGIHKHLIRTNKRQAEEITRLENQIAALSERLDKIIDRGR